VHDFGQRPEGGTLMEPAVAHTALGDLRGIWQNGVATFRGVPFAEPPVGELRFAAAEPVQPWRGLRDATQHGPIAPQLQSRLSLAMGEFQRPQSEDCLTLTIATPAADGKARPVLVWFHGGAWITGAGSLDWYDGSTLVHEGDIVFVGVNYRLGALGWLHRPGIVDTDSGISDMLAALAWVRDNIAAFGGDPSCVTVMGQSAGATSIGRLLMLPEARALFHRAIMQSGGYGRGAYTSAMASERADQFLRLLAIDPEAGDVLSRLRALEVPRILAAQADLARSNARFAFPGAMFMPVFPEAMSLREMLSAIADGAEGKPLLIGATADEVHAFFAADPSLQNPSHDEVVRRFGGEAALARYRARRPGASAMDLLADLVTDETFLRPAMDLAMTVAECRGTAFAYVFDWRAPASRFHACHCIELPFVFGTFDAWVGAPMLAGGHATQMGELSASMRQAWIAFARSGRPSPTWPRHDVDRRAVMRFGSRIGAVGDLG
jgi:para-nitrobenzyl esterase